MVVIDLFFPKKLFTLSNLQTHSYSMIRTLVTETRDCENHP